MTTAHPRYPSASASLSVTVDDRPDSAPGSALAQCAFGTAWAEAVAHPGLRLLDDSPKCETWRTPAPAERGSDGNVSWARAAHLLFGSVALPLQDDHRDTAHAAYREIFACARRHGYPHLLRIWNFLPQINVGHGDAERYKRFCLGRAEAFDEAPWVHDQFPAGTAIGTRSGQELLVYFLSGASPGRRIENPRQVNAPAYPRRYGLRRPRFCRAMAWPGEGEATLLVSGTASIVGYESRHPNDVERQLGETWRNLEALRAHAGANGPTALRVYLRHEQDLPRIREVVAERVAAATPVIYLQADICRAELAVEVEGVYTIPGEAHP
jgi:chorismate lyase/3-hydroxybenzoate synthase